MASSKTNICNAALMLCGVGDEIANIEERSPEAEACLQFYDSTLERLLVKLRLPSTMKRVALALIEEDPSDEFGYSYATPTDFLSSIKLVSGLIPETSGSHIPFKRVSKDGLDCLWTNQEDAELEYIYRLTDESLFPPLLAEAMEYALAMKIAPRLVRDPAKLGPLLKALDEGMRTSCRANGQNEHFPGTPPESEFIRGRN